MYEAIQSAAQLCLRYSCFTERELFFFFLQNYSLVQDSIILCYVRLWYTYYASVVSKSHLWGLIQSLTVDFRSFIDIKEL